MINMNFIEVLTTIFGVVMSVGHFPQAYTMWKNQSSENVSWLTYGVFAVGTTIWLVYGVSKMEMPIIASYAPGVIGSWLVVFLKVMYRKKNV
jgi:MtN3 and saliva related transmembrane protein